MALLTEPARYALLGSVLGACFSVGALILLFILGDLRLDAGLLGGLAQAHRDNPLLFIIHIAPFVLGLLFFFIGIQQARIRRFARGLEDDIEEKTRDLKRALEETQLANVTIRHLAEHDALTGLLNRRRFQRDLEQWSAHALRYGRDLALMFLDLDNFKHVNDTYGHVVGDEYLKGMAALVRDCLRSSDYVGRWGGDELAVLLPETDAAEAGHVATKLLEAFEHTPVVAGAREWHVAASIGIATLPSDTADPQELVAFADAAMYEAKQSGGGAWRAYTGTRQEQERIQDRLGWEARLRGALAAERFVLYYQPVLDLETGATPMFEALLRMQEPDGALLMPKVFLPRAEEFHLCGALDRVAIGMAVRQVVALADAGMKARISVNLSASSLRDRTLASFVVDAAAQAGVAPRCLAFEVAEALAAPQEPVMMHVAADLRAAGSELILDDFGAGFSSVHVLGRLSITMVKLDGRFVAELDDAGGRDLLRDLVRIAGERDIAVVAKAVEERARVEQLRRYGVQYGQGYALGRPVREPRGARACVDATPSIAER